MKDKTHEYRDSSGNKTELYFAILCGVFLLVGFIIQKLTNLSNWFFLSSYIISYFFGSYFITIEAYKKIIKGGFDIDFLMIAAAAGAFYIDKWAEGALLLFLFSLGHALEHFAMNKAKKSIDRLSQKVKESSIARNLPEEITEGERRSGMLSKQDFIDIVNQNINEGGYLSRLYQIFNDDNFKLADDVRSSLVDQIVEGKGLDISHVKRFLQDEQGSYSIDDAFVRDWRAGNVKLTPLQADRYIDNVTKYYKGLKNAKPRSSTGVSIPVVRLNPGVVNKPQVDNEVIKAIMGEIRTPKEAYIHTIAELSNFIAADTFYTGFKRSADASIIGTATRNAENIARGGAGDEIP